MHCLRCPVNVRIVNPAGSADEASQEHLQGAALQLLGLRHAADSGGVSLDPRVAALAGTQVQDERAAGARLLAASHHVAAVKADVERLLQVWRLAAVSVTVRTTYWHVYLPRLTFAKADGMEVEGCMLAAMRRA